MEDKIRVYESNLDWDHLWLLGWYDHNGQGYLTTWEGSMPYVHVVITGVKGINFPLWRAPVPQYADIHEIPEGKDPKEYAKEIGGYYAFGWLLEDLIERK